MWAWHENVRVGHIDARRNCQLTVLNSDGKPVAKYYLKNAWPSTLDVGSLKPGTPEVLAEMVTLTCESITRVNP
jgi:phage tail-like protein